MQRQKGFGAVGIILALVVVVALIGLGWYVWRNKHVKVAPANNSASQETEQAEQYAGWKTHTSAIEKFSFKYPSDWELTIIPSQGTLIDRQGCAGRIISCCCI